MDDVWSESVIDGYPVVASNTCPQEKEHENVFFLNLKNGNQNL